MDEANEQPAGHEIGLAPHHRIQERAIGVLRPRSLGVVAGDHMVRQPPQGLCIALRGDILEGADADVLVQVPL